MTTFASEHTPEQSRSSLLYRGRYAFRAWRRGRPFWGSLFVMLGGIEIIWIPYSPIGVVVHEGIAGIGGMFIGALMIMFALSAAFAPAYRVFAGIASILLALVALPATNFGGFLVGTLCALFGGAFAVAWAPRPGMTAETRRQRRKAQKEAEPAAAAQPADGYRFEAGQPAAADEQITTTGFSESEIAAAELAARAPDEPEAQRVPEPTAELPHPSIDPED